MESRLHLAASADPDRAMDAAAAVVFERQTDPARLRLNTLLPCTVEAVQAAVDALRVEAKIEQQAVVSSTGGGRYFHIAFKGELGIA
eukprot:4930278-Lingulodinium_polyedra.AAC.1